jgi:hypothetical protein
MYNNKRINILSEHELSSLSIPCQEIKLDKLCNSYPRQETHLNKQTCYKYPSSLFRQQNQPKSMLKNSCTLRTVSITTDDILDLRIELAQCKDVLQFIEKL